MCARVCVYVLNLPSTTQSTAHEAQKAAWLRGGRRERLCSKRVCVCVCVCVPLETTQAKSVYVLPAFETYGATHEAAALADTLVSQDKVRYPFVHTHTHTHIYTTWSHP